MSELGNSFSFIGSEYKIKIGDRNHYIDLLLFNIKFNCYVVIELKVTQFKVEYISQVQKYMNYIDKNIKEISNNNTMGILICKRENKFVIEYCSDERIAIREYQLVWNNTYRGDIMANDALTGATNQFNCLEWWFKKKAIALGQTYFAIQTRKQKLKLEKEVIKQKEK